MAAEVALACDVQLWVPMPMAQAEYERDFTTPESLEEFRRLLGAAQSQWEINDSVPNETSPADTVNRAQKYAAVGDYIAQKSHVLILLWDGRHNEKVGGTSWVKTRREDWMRVGMAPAVFGYVGTVHVVTPRETTAGGTQQRQRVEIAGELPPGPKPQTDIRSKL